MNLDNLISIFGSRSKALEIFYLIHNAKSVVRHGFYDKELIKVKDFCEKNNLAIEIAPYKVILADPENKFSNKGFKTSIEDPRSGMHFVYISRDEQKAAEANTYEYKNDHKRLGLLLGYPECCCDFFVKNEPERSRLDNDYLLCTLKNSKGLSFPFQNNIAIRDKDITLLSHFPCSFSCQKSIEIAKKHLKLISELDTNLAMKYVNDLKGRHIIGGKKIDFV
jgi:hypothetical protein